MGTRRAWAQAIVARVVNLAPVYDSPSEAMAGLVCRVAGLAITVELVDNRDAGVVWAERYAAALARFGF